MYSIDGMILIGETEVLGEKNFSSATVTNKNLTRTDLRPKLGFRIERPATNRLSHDTVV